MTEEPTRLPSIDGIRSHEELDAFIFGIAKYFTVVQYNRGGIHNNGKPWDREEVPDFETAQRRARERYEADGRIAMIYAVADISGCFNFSRHMENYPPCKLPFSWARNGKGPPKPSAKQLNARKRPNELKD